MFTYSHNMGVRYLIRNLENIGGRLPFPIEAHNKKDYKDIVGLGNLQYVGFDGSVLIHSKIISEKRSRVYIKQSALEIVKTVLNYLEMIINYFDTLGGNEEKNIILHFVIDGKPPCKKNRRKIIDDEGNETFILDAYSLMPSEEKKILHQKIIKYLKRQLSFFKYKKINLLSNYNVDENERGEGEIELYKMCQRLNNNNNNNKNVIVSSDSDLISLMLLHHDTNLVIISPIKQSIYITNFTLMTKALNLTTDFDIFKYILLHFIFFGSDYNLGLMTNPNESKQKVISNAIKNNLNKVDEIGQKCIRKRKLEIQVDDEHFLQKFKQLLIYEAICAFMYYFDTQNGVKYLLDYSPRLYDIPKAKDYIHLLEFC